MRGEKLERQTNTEVSEQKAMNTCSFTFQLEVGRELKRVDISKLAGPDGITGRVRRSCADQVCLFPSLMSPLLPLWFPPTSVICHHPYA